MLDTEPCPECGKSIPVLSPRCEHCGANLAAGDEEPEASIAEQIADHERISDEEYERQERRYRRREVEEGDSTGGIIPYKNGPALAAYYCGVFAVIPCFPIGLAQFA